MRAFRFRTIGVLLFLCIGLSLLAGCSLQQQYAQDDQNYHDDMTGLLNNYHGPDRQTYVDETNEYQQHVWQEDASIGVTTKPSTEPSPGF